MTALGLANVCATDWIGMSSDDIGVVAQVLADLGRFDEIADRMVQGLVNVHALGISTIAPDGFASAHGVDGGHDSADREQGVEATRS